MSGRGGRGAQPQRLRLRVDPVACEGVGICAHLAAGSVTVDSWGYPIVPTGPLHQRDLRAAAAAVGACPRKALFLEPLAPGS